MVRAVVADVALSPHVEAARIAGLGEAAVLRRHILPSVAGPITQVLALLVPYLVGGTLVVETVFAYPGLGALLADAVAARDAVEVEDGGMILATVSVGAFLAAELLHAPRRRTGSADAAGPPSPEPRALDKSVPLAPAQVDG
jgi:peptide/nickel transport system permease protein